MEGVPELNENTEPQVPCPYCNRLFAQSRLEKHSAICAAHPERQVFDITKQRVAGTEAEALVKAGKLVLEKPRPNAKKSTLKQQIQPPGENGHSNGDNKKVLPPIPPKKDKTAYQVIFDDDDRMKTKRNTRLPLHLTKSKNKKNDAKEQPTMKTTTSLPEIDESLSSRYLSAERARGAWQSAAHRAHPGLSLSLSRGLKNGEEDDMLAASMASQKTVASDAFDFLFDSQNLNPNKMLDRHEIERYTEEKMRASNEKGSGNNNESDDNEESGARIDEDVDELKKKNNVVKGSSCCVIS